ncbi:MAG: hypothetical protein JW807_09500 [Spirochaetes bacterium]|nr:hypothetical protein [Spirochaetota bacterium]
MAFGRDGSELELSIFDLQNRKMREALRSIIEKSGDEEVVRIAEDALREAEEIGMKLSGE